MSNSITAMLAKIFICYTEMHREDTEDHRGKRETFNIVIE
jgi:hypothetical protein